MSEYVKPSLRKTREVQKIPRLYLNIKEKRVQMNMTQETLAHKVGVKRTTISRYETSGRTPPIAIIKQIADVFGCTVDDLLGKRDAS
ncbi:MAG: helix-turn-helix transcriptional regulator [Candidatus Limiplasma sp.]|nr:helix-turn-helix transcriptional regulator [Candidatus Limiplasma sp.]